MTTFLAENKYIQTNNVVGCSNEKLNIQSWNTDINKWHPSDDYIHILCLVKKWLRADAYYKPAAAPVMHSTEVQRKHIKKKPWALSQKICWLPVNENENTIHGRHGFVTQQVTWQQWLRQTVCVNMEGGHSQAHSPYLLRRKRDCHHTKSKITLLCLYMYLYIYRNGVLWNERQDFFFSSNKEISVNSWKTHIFTQRIHFIVANYTNVTQIGDMYYIFGHRQTTANSHCILASVRLRKNGGWLSREMHASVICCCVRHVILLSPGNNTLDCISYWLGVYKRAFCLSLLFDWKKKMSHWYEKRRS